MSEQANNTTGTTEGQGAQSPMDDLGKLLKFLTNPAVASAASAFGLYFAINPREIKKSLGDIQEQMDTLLSLTKKQNARISALEQMLLEQDDEQQDEDERQQHDSTRDYRKASKRRSSAYLD